MNSLEKEKEEELRFLFGKNWNNFIQFHFSEERVNISKKNLLAFLEVGDLANWDVLDIGSGSGLHSLAMVKAGAKTVTSFDYDEQSYSTTSYLAKKFGSNNWTVRQGSVLDSNFMSSLPSYQLVYSWGVLHHTGNVWKALENASEKVKSNGLFFIALYSKDALAEEPEYWLNIKKRYNKGSGLTKRLLELWYIVKFELGYNPFAFFSFLNKYRTYKTQRGMNKLVDIRDWLGGWPMEFVGDKDAVFYLEKRGFELVKMKTGEANTEFLFRKL